jgi:hypothetical protein
METIHRCSTYAKHEQTIPGRRLQSHQHRAPAASSHTTAPRMPLHGPALCPGKSCPSIIEKNKILMSISEHQSAKNALKLHTLTHAHIRTGHKYKQIYHFIFPSPVLQDDFHDCGAVLVGGDQQSIGCPLCLRMGYVFVLFAQGDVEISKKERKKVSK